MKFGFLRKSNTKLILLLIIILGLLVRALYLFSSPFTPDESTYGLAMVHILNGKEWPVFFYAQPYTGTQSAIIAVALAKVFGFWPWFLKVVPLLFSVGLIFTNYLVGRKVYRIYKDYKNYNDYIFNEEEVGLLAALFTAFLPSFAQNWSVRAGSGYPEVAFVGSLCLLIYLEITNLKRNSISKSSSISNSTSVSRTIFGNFELILKLRLMLNLKLRSDILFFLLGFLAGFGYWIQPAIAYFLIPLAFLFFLWEPKFFFKRWFYFALSGLAIGAAPVIYYNLNTDLSTGRALLNKPGGIKNAFLIFFTHGMPPLLGTRASWTYKDYFLPLAILVWATYAAAFLVPFTALAQGIVSVIRGKRMVSDLLNGFRGLFLKDPRMVLLLVCVVAPPIFAFSPFNWFAVEPRYIYPLYAVLPVLLAGFLLIDLPLLLKKVVSEGVLHKLPGLLVIAPFLLICVVLASNFLSMVSARPNSRPTSYEKQFSLTKVVEFLREEDIKYVYSSFRFCHRLILESKEDIICTPFEGGFGEWRYPVYRDLVANAPKEQKGFVFLAEPLEEGSEADSFHPALQRCKEDLSNQNDPCHEKIIDGFRISWYR